MRKGQTLIRRTAALSTFLIGVALLAGCSDHKPDTPQVQGSWQTTGALSVGRAFYFATVPLPSGKVLVAGGRVNQASGYPATESVELFDPNLGYWTPAASMPAPRSSDCAALLLNGKVLVAGGFDGADLDTAALYDPATNTWAPTAGTLAVAHDLATCVLLQSGKVLVAGGVNTTAQFSAELYDPSTGLFTPTGSMATPRYWHTATLLRSGKVLVTGGCAGSYPCVDTLKSTELYDPQTGLWSSAGDLPQGVFGHTATRLASDQVLVAGGCRDDGWCGPVTNSTADAESAASLYDPAVGIAGLWSATGAMMHGHVGHAALLLASGDVLVVGGGFRPWTSTFTERYHPATGTWALGPATTVDHGAYFGAASLREGRWLVLGGVGPGASTGAHYLFSDRAEIFTE